MKESELLELAAKAVYAKPDGQSADGTLHFGNSRWNPLIDDGHALQLLCRLSLRIVENHGGTYRAVQFTLHAETDEAAEHEIEIEWPHTPAATRYAIVRAAAAMAEAKQKQEGNDASSN